MNPIQTIAGRFGGGQAGKRARKTLAIAFVALLAFSVVAPFLGFAFVDSDHAGTAAAEIENSTFNQSFDYTTSFNVNPQDTRFNGDGTKMYVLGPGQIAEYDLSSPWDISTATHVQTNDFSEYGAITSGIDFSGDGKKAIVSYRSAERVSSYTLSTAWDISTMSHKANLSTTSQDTSPNGAEFNDDGTKMFISGGGNLNVYEYDLSTAYDITTATYSQSFDVSTQSDNPNDVSFNGDGTKMFVPDSGGTDGGIIYEYGLSTGFDLSTASYSSNNYDMSSEDQYPQSTAFGAGGSYMYAPGNGNDNVYQYDTSISGYTSTVSGTVTNASDGTGLGGATVTLKQSGSVVDSTTADASGNYKISGVSDGDYTVEAANDGYHTDSAAITVAGSDVTQNFALDPVLVTGYVEKPGGAGIEGAKVTLEQSGSILRSTRTNASGGYEFSTVTDGAYTVAASSSDHDDAAADISVSRATVRQDFALPSNADGASGQAIGLLEDDLGVFLADDTDLQVFKRTKEYRPLWQIDPDDPREEWYRTSWSLQETKSFNWENRTYVELTDGAYYRLELHSTHGTWEESGFKYDKSEMLESTVWLSPGTRHLDSNGDGTAGGSSSSGTNGPGDGSDSTSDDDSTSTEDDGFGPTALGSCTTTDGQDGVEVEYWDPGYETYELRANLSVDGESTYFIHKTFDDARGYYRGCLADVMTNNASDSRDTVFEHNATDLDGAVVSSGSTSYSPPIFGPSGVAPASTGERLGLLAGVLVALGALWFGGNRYVPGTSVEAWPVDSVSPAFGVGAPLVAVLGLDLAGGGVISASVATGLAQIAPFAGIVGVTIAGYYALRWIRAPPTS